MTQPVPACLQRLALGIDADTREIRRAYARELKLIDQQADLHGFQSLRDMYQSALAWAAREERRRGEPEPVFVAALAPQGGPLAAASNAHADADALAEMAFARFAACAKAMAEQGAGDDPARWEAALRQRLDDEELLNITARQLFEARIADLLTNGAMAERGPLFTTASVVFNWEHDRRRLRQFGHAGALLDRVIDERSMFEAQTTGQLQAQRDVMRRLHEAGTPDAHQLLRDQPYLQRMLERFPNFMAMMVDAQVVHQWRAIYKEQSRQAYEYLGSGPPPKTAPPIAPVPPRHPGKLGWNKSWILFLLIGLTQLIRMFNVQPSPPIMEAYNSAPPAQAYSTPYGVPASTGPSIGDMLQAAKQAIEIDIDYRPTPSAPKGVRTVAFTIVADTNGGILGVEVISRSPDRAFDDAVEAAIMRSQPLPRALGVRVPMEFSTVLEKRFELPKP